MRLALLLKIFFDAATQALLDNLVGVHKRATEFAGNLSPDC